MPEWDRPQTARTTLTEPHRRLKALIERAGFWVQDELSVGKYSVDCYVHELHLGFEADGGTHRGRSSSRKDAARDLWILENAGIPLLRVTDVELGTEASREAAYAKVLAFIDEHAETVEARRQVAIDTLGGVR